MSTALDLPGARRYTDDLNERAGRCDNGEGMICSNLDESIRLYVELCDQLRDYVNQWARAVFAGQLAFDPEVDSLLNSQVRRILRRTKRLAAQGRAMDGECFDLGGLDALHYHIADLDYLLENWVKPRPAVGPAPRVAIPDAAARQIDARLTSLPPLPADWLPSDPAQLVFFQKQRGR